MVRSVLIVGLALTLAACGESALEPDVEPAEIDAQIASPTAPEPIVEPEPEPEPAVPLPTIIGQQTDAYSVRAEFPFKLEETAPLLGARLRADAELDFAQLAAMADQDAAKEGEYFRPYDLTVEWTVAATAGDLISVQGQTYSETGGAHGNRLLEGVIHDHAKGEDISLLDLFDDREIALEVLVPLVREQIMVEKMIRYDEKGEPTPQRIVETAESLPDHGRWLSEVILVPSTEASMIGGLKVLFSPYDIGAYAEGSYDATVSQAGFRDVLKDEYQGLFAGEPAPEKAD